LKTPNDFAVLVVETGGKECNGKGRKEVTCIPKKAKKNMFKRQRAEGKAYAEAHALRTARMFPTVELSHDGEN